MEALRIDAGQTRSPRSGVLKSRGCDTMTGATESFSEWRSESREHKGLGRSAPDQCTLYGKKGRNDGNLSFTLSTAQRYLVPFSQDFPPGTTSTASNAFRTMTYAAKIWIESPVGTMPQETLWSTDI